MDAGLMYEEVDMHHESDAKNTDSENETQEAVRGRRSHIVVKKESVLGVRSPQQEQQQSRIHRPTATPKQGTRVIPGQKLYPITRHVKLGQIISPHSLKRKPDGSPLVVQLDAIKRTKPGESPMARPIASSPAKVRIMKVAQTQTDVTADVMEQYNQLIEEDQERIAVLEETVRKLKYSPEMFENDDKRTQYFTGLESFVNMVTLFNSCEGHLPASNSVTKFEIFILTMLRLRLKVPIPLLGFMFGVPAKKALYFYNEGITVLHMVMRDIFSDSMELVEEH